MNHKVFNLGGFLELEDSCAFLSIFLFDNSTTLLGLTSSQYTLEGIGFLQLEKKKGIVISH